MHSGTKSAFVIMPIRTEGTPEHSHFRALYDYTIKPTVTASGYQVTRSDEINKAGSITKDIIARIGAADLVVADLTDLNPNVFWELGVRHTLLAHGTIALIDETRTESIPFDLSPYRVIKYRGELEGLGHLKDRLASFIQSFEGDGPRAVDSPVHDWLPKLPPSLLAATEGSADAEARETLARVSESLAAYEKTFGPLPGVAAASGVRPLDVVIEIQRDVESGNDAISLTSAASDAAQAGDQKRFLQIVRRALERDSKTFSGRFFRQLAIFADRLGLDRVHLAIAQHASSADPSDQELARTYMSSLAHSGDRSNRERARQGLKDLLGIATGADGIQVPMTWDADLLSLFGIMMDAYHSDGMHEDALRIAEQAAKAYPGRSAVVRNYARSLDRAGRGVDEVLAAHVESILCADADDVSALWLGSELSSRDRKVDAVEACVLSCLFEPDDCGGFASTAAAILDALRDALMPFARDPRTPPPEVNERLVVQFVAAGLSCGVIRQKDVDTLSKSCDRIGLKLTEVEAALKGKHSPLPTRLADVTELDISERISLALRTYKLVRSSLTARLQVPADDPIEHQVTAA